MENAEAIWSLSLDTYCPECDKHMDILNEYSDSFIQDDGGIEICEYGTRRTKNFEVECECGHEFKVDFIY